jgi:hypothetical protein
MALLSGCCPVFAQESPTPSGAYFRDLGRIIGRIRAVQWTADICAETYPETKSENQAAVDAWQRKYQPFVMEMTKKFDALPAYWVAHDPSGTYSVPKINDMLNRMMVQGRYQLKKQYLVDQGLERFQETCKAYPLALQSEGFDFERSYRNEVAEIRRVP